MSGATTAPDGKIKVLIVDDSRIFRAFVEKALAEAQDIEVVGSLGSGLAALEYIKTRKVDVITLDVEMPVCDGLETLVAITKFSDSPPDVIMLSAHTRKGAETTIRALEAGACDFIAKPSGPDAEQNVEQLRRQLLVKIRCLSSKKSLSRPGGAHAPAAPQEAPQLAVPDSSRVVGQAEVGRYRCVVIGVSTGGPKALSIMLPELMKVTPLPILITQHMPPDFTKSLAESLSRHCPSPVVEAHDGQLVEWRHAYIAPGGHHMLLRKVAKSGICVAINDQPPENGCRPSVDVLFRSAAAVYGGLAIALILTGMGTDGTKGLGPLKRAGAHVIAQDEETSIVWGMPGSAVAANLVDEVCPIGKIAEAVGRLRQARGADAAALQVQGKTQNLNDAAVPHATV